MRLSALLLASGLLAVSCSPLRSSPSDPQHLFELTLHEVQTNLDDLRHDINCFRSELQILEGRIKSHEGALTALRHQDLEKQQTKIDQIAKSLTILEKSWGEKEQAASPELKQLTHHAKETSLALKQFKERILEIENELLSQQRRFETASRQPVENSADKLYRVKQGDTLEKIARNHQTSVEKIKRLNELEKDSIFIGQQLKIPSE
jgi:LysM repeat protein